MIIQKGSVCESWVRWLCRVLHHRCSLIDSVLGAVEGSEYCCGVFQFLATTARDRPPLPLPLHGCFADKVFTVETHSSVTNRICVVNSSLCPLTILVFHAAYVCSRLHMCACLCV